MLKLQLRSVASHPRGTTTSSSQFAFSTRNPSLIIAAQDLIIEQDIATNAVTSTVRTPAKVDKLVYVGNPPTVLAFLEDGHVAAYDESPTGLRLREHRPIVGTDRSVVLADGAPFGPVAVFVKADSPSVWCLRLRPEASLPDPFKLRADVEGLQENVKFIDGTVAKIRGHVTAKSTGRIVPVVAVAVHPSLNFVAAGYSNGIIRVWDTDRKEQRTHLSVQLLMKEAIVDVAFHPSFPVVVACTTLGRILSYLVQTMTFKFKGQPMLPTSKTRVRKRKFRSMCFSHTSPEYLLLLTASNRIVVRLVNSAGVILTSARFPKVSRPLAVDDGAVIASEVLSPLEDMYENDVSEAKTADIASDTAFGVIACTLDKSGSAYVFQPTASGIPVLRSPFSNGIDTPFSDVRGQEILGAVELASDSLVAFSNTLFSYTLGSEQLQKLCRLPAGDIRSMDVARDENGYCTGALIFYDGDDAVDSTEYSDALETARFVLCTRPGGNDDWVVSEPAEAKTGCFLKQPGRHDGILVVDNSGTRLSITSFASSTSSQANNQRGRGVKRFQLAECNIAKVFRTPFTSWNAVLYHEATANHLAVSKHAFVDVRQIDQIEPQEIFQLDTSTAVALRENEVVVDVRWQRNTMSASQNDYFGAIMTERRIIIIRDVLSVMSCFEFSSISRLVVPFTPPSFAWSGPSLMVLHGNSLFSVSMDGKHDLVAGLGSGTSATALMACLPDRISYATPVLDGKVGTLCVRSRPYSGTSPMLRGVLSLPDAKTEIVNSGVVNRVLEHHDVSQGSAELANSLISAGLPGVAYKIAMSEKGKHMLPALARAVFLVRMGDIRSALCVIEGEYTRLSCKSSFHDGMELYRLLQRVQNMAFILGDFEVCRRCSQLLGRRGTFAAFVDSEGGYDALRTAMEVLNGQGDGMGAEKLGLQMERSSNSSVANDIGILPSRREVRAMRQAITNAKASVVGLGNVDKREMFIRVVEEIGEGAKMTRNVKRVELSMVYARNVGERLETLRVVAKAMEDGGEGFDMGYAAMVEEKAADVGAWDESLVEGSGIGDSSDEQEEKNNVDKKEVGAGVKMDNENFEHMLPMGSGKLTATTMAGMVNTQEMLQAHMQESRAIAAGTAQAGRSQIAGVTGAIVSSEAGSPEVKAGEMLGRACEKLKEDRLKAAQKDVEHGIRAVVRGVERGVHVRAGVLGELVQYRFLCRLRRAMEEVVESELGSTTEGRLTYAEFAMAGTRLGLRTEDRVRMLMLAVDGNMLLGNFGSAAQGLKMIKELGTPQGLRENLRQRYAVCQTRAFVEALPTAGRNVCFMSLKVVPAEVRMLGCSVCVAVYAVDGGVVLGGQCEYCQMGRIIVR